jgi:adenosine deaminase
MFRGDVKAIERMAFEFCEDEAANGVAYVEARFSPHLLAQGEVTPKHVVEAVWKGFQRGEQQFGVKVGRVRGHVYVHL